MSHTSSALFSSIYCSRALAWLFHAICHCSSLSASALSGFFSGTFSEHSQSLRRFFSVSTQSSLLYKMFPTYELKTFSLVSWLVKWLLQMFSNLLYVVVAKPWLFLISCSISSKLPSTLQSFQR